MNILCLYSEVMDYSFSTMRILVERGFRVHVVYWDDPTLKLSMFEPKAITGVTLYKRSVMSYTTLTRLINHLNPSIIVVSGWMDRLYLHVLLRMRLKVKHAKVVCALDNQWTGTLKQKIARLLGSLSWHKLLYDFAWVAGYDQYEYARIIGFERSKIVFDYYSADLSKFQSERGGLRSSLSKRFLYVGRLAESKNIELLIAAWAQFSMLKKGWSLTVVGRGSLATMVASAEVDWIEYLEPSKLAEVFTDHDVFILPSKDEHWGVVIHEAVAAGLPIISSDACGASKTFVISGFNGYTFESDNLGDLVRVLLEVSSLSDTRLIEMSRGSKLLSTRITPQTSANNLLSILK